jgi:nifR3 family TIM-barrel protein
MPVFLLKPLRLGTVVLEGNILCAPLAGFTDAAFREFAVDAGADLCFTEMVSCEALIRENRKTRDLLVRGRNENNYGIQVFTSSPESASAAMECITPLAPAVVDLNCGCPVPKVIKTGAGAALMKDPVQIGEIVRAMKKATSLPISVKLRTGWDHQNYTFIEAALRAQDAGASMISLHGRTRSQGYGGKADWEQIARLKEAVEVPVTGNGDIFTAEDARNMLKQTGCDAVMVARGALGNPFLFREIRSLLAGLGVLPPPTPRERIETALRHLERCVALKGEALAVKEMKKQLCSYTKGISGSAAFRNQLVHCERLTEYREHFSDFLASLQD